MLKGAINLITAIFMAGSPAAGTASQDITPPQVVVAEALGSEQKTAEKEEGGTNITTNPQVNPSEQENEPKRMEGYSKLPKTELKGPEIPLEDEVKNEPMGAEEAKKELSENQTALTTTETPEPAVTEAEATTEGPEPAVTEPEATAEGPEPAVTEPEATTETPEAAVTEALTTAEAPEPAVTEAQEQPAESPQEAAPQVQDNNYDWDIASYTTHYSTSKGNYNRNFNMQLASDAINGTILQPGESFSYNGTILGKRDRNNDYKPAGILIAGKPATGIGGGICQISSTLYEAALYSGMTITERHNHSAMVGYMPAGRDATVSWGGPDLCFRNDLSAPVKIESVMGDGTIKIRFLAMEDPQIGNIEVSVSRRNGGYVLTRYRDGVADYSASSWY